MPASERRVAIVTGGARGIGRGCAHAIAQKGVDIVLVDLLEDKLPGTKAEIQGLGVACETFVADVADHGRAKQIAAAVLSRFGRIDILVNNAGKAQPKGILELAEDEWDRTIAVNLKSCFNYSQAVAPTMLERKWGRIVSMSSVNAHSGGVTAAVSLRHFAHSALSDTKPRQRAHQFRSGNVKSHQPHTRWPQQNRDEFRPHHADEVVDSLRPADDGGGLKNLAVAIGGLGHS